MNTSDVVNRLTYHRTRQGPLLDYLDDADPLLSVKLGGCGSWLHIREWELSREARLRNANFCKCFLVCQSCAARRAVKMVKAYASKVERVQAANPGLIPVMITLTVRNGPVLRERLHHLKQSWKRMLEAARKGKSTSGRHPLVEWNKVVGSVRAIEVTYNKKAEEWHPHIHVFALVSAYVNPFHLSAEWERFTGDSMVVDVRECKNGTGSALVEVLKYVSKPSELPPALLHHLYETAKGSRFTDPQGLLRGVPEPDIDSDEDEDLHGPYRDFILIWSGWGYHMEAVSDRLKILKPGDAGYGPPRDVGAVPIDDSCFDSSSVFSPSYKPDESPESIARDRESRALAITEKRLKEAAAWEAKLRQRLRNWRVSGEDPVRLKLLIQDARFCQGSMFSIPRGGSFRRFD